MYEAVLRGKFNVAVKILKTSSKRVTRAISNSTKSSRHRASSAVLSGSALPSGSHDPEIEFLMRTRHERLVTFFGHGTNEQGEPFLVMELMEFSLDKLLWRRPPWRLYHRLLVLVDVVSALTYLHLTHKALHLDLKSSNVLAYVDPLTNLFRAKLSDFGAAKIVLRGKKKRTRKVVITEQLTKKLQLSCDGSITRPRNSSASSAESNVVQNSPLISPSPPVGPYPKSSISKIRFDDSPSSEDSNISTMTSLSSQGRHHRRRRLWTKRMVVQGTVEWMAPEILRAGAGASADIGMYFLVLHIHINIYIYIHSHTHLQVHPWICTHVVYFLQKLRHNQDLG